MMQGESASRMNILTKWNWCFFCTMLVAILRIRNGLRCRWSKSAYPGQASWMSSVDRSSCEGTSHGRNRQLVSFKGPKLDALGVRTLEWPQMWVRNGSYDNLDKNLAMLADWGMDPAGQRKVVITTPVIVEFPPESTQKTLVWLLDVLGCSKKEVAKIAAAHPRVFQCSISETLDPFLRMFVDGQYATHQVRQMVLRNPQVLGKNKKAAALVECLGSMLSLSPKKDVLKLLLICPQLLGHSLEKTIKPNVERLLQLEISTSDVDKIVIRAPELLLCDFDLRIASKISWLQKELGLDGQTSLGMLAAHPRVFVYNLTLWITNRNFLLGLGFSLEKTAELLTRAPFILSMKPAYLREKFEFARTTLRKGHDEIFACPDYFTHSFGDRILMRAAFLDCRGEDITKWTLPSLVKQSYKSFEGRFSPGEFEKFSQEWAKLDKEKKLQILNPRLRFDNLIDGTDSVQHTTEAG